MIKIANHQPQGSLQAAILREQLMPQYDSKSFKSFVPIIKNKDYYNICEKNMWDNKYRMSQKMKDLNHFEEIEDIVDKKIKVRKEKEDKQQSYNQCQDLKFNRIQSAGRIQNRQKEMVHIKSLCKIHTQYLSNQNLNDEQLSKLKCSISDERPYKTGQVTRIINQCPDNQWNHHETTCSKQLNNYFTKKIVKYEKDTFERIKSRVQYDEDVQNQRRIIITQNKEKIQASFKQKQDENNVILNKLGLKKNRTEIIEPQKSANSELFERLSHIKQVKQIFDSQQYKPENTTEMPDFRNFISSKIGKIDEIQNPDLINIFSDSRPIKKNILLQTKRRILSPKFRTELHKVINQTEIPKKISSNQNITDLPVDTIDCQNNQDHELKDTHVVWEINDFEQKFKSTKNAYFSQIKEKELNYLKDFDGYKSLQAIKKSAGIYQIKIGDMIREQRKGNE